MVVLNHLEPQRVFHFFEELCAIPHGSGNTKAVSDWLVDFAKARGLRYVQDQLNNVVIFQDAAPGYESAEPVILQGHMDMVCEKEPGCTKDMAVEGLDLVLEGDTVSAKGTTLGGDDGIAVAMALAILDDTSLSHPAIEAIFTVDEETGMYGAEGLDVSVLKGRRMLNMDSEDEGVFTVSCAGGARADCCLPIRRQQFGAPVQEIAVTGLVGGHSGAEIDKGRANSSMLLGRVLCALEPRAGRHRQDRSAAHRLGGERPEGQRHPHRLRGPGGRRRRRRPGRLRRNGRRLQKGIPGQRPRHHRFRPSGGVLSAAHGRGLQPQRRVPACLPAQRHSGHERRHARPGPDLSESGHPHHR